MAFAVKIHIVWADVDALLNGKLPKFLCIYNELSF